VNNINQLYVMAALHGDETFGLKIQSYLNQVNDIRINTAVGNPEAVAKRREYIESDLNRSFSINIDTKETRLAKKILADIKRSKPDLIIDIHTCECDVGKVAILAQDDEWLITLARKLGMDQVVVMHNDLARQSLIGQNPNRSICLEFGSTYRSDKLAEKIASNIAGLLNGTSGYSSNVTHVYHVVGTIDKSHNTLDLKNYVFHSKLKGYPFLVGKNSYINYAGFLAKRKPLSQAKRIV